MKVVIINYNAGNIRSVDFALRRMNIDAEITGSAEKILGADKVIFPGVGEASTTMHYLHKHGLVEVIRSLKQPLLGICLGLQLLCSHSEEGNTPCIGIFKEKVKKFPAQVNNQRYKIPHMGWNTIANLKPGMFNPQLEGRHVYFVHSYYAELGEHTAAVTNYGANFSSALQKDNFYATQFHPEKSGDVGAQILKNFIAL
ncbi:MAG: imidazole glycerol phosphate synthase subunit HisH [Bacteroidales bacterium]|nr:imidazole glycerol phosphate synthase subunit HisH [Bacteroidales bacterium]